MRASASYRKQRLVWHNTRPSPVAIGIRKAPAPQGLPGYIRIDTVHQGDQDGIKGVYHINAVDIVTQWELAASVERISEAYLLPVIALLLEGFPFVIRGFHSDSGSEYVNHEIARLYNTGARVQEAADVRVKHLDLNLQPKYICMVRVTNGGYALCGTRRSNTLGSCSPTADLRRLRLNLCSAHAVTSRSLAMGSTRSSGDTAHHGT